MPKISGIKTARNIRRLEDESKSRMTIFAHSAFDKDDHEIIDEVFGNGFDKFITKPLKSHALMDVLRQSNLIKSKKGEHNRIMVSLCEL